MQIVNHDGDRCVVGNRGDQIAECKTTAAQRLIVATIVCSAVEVRGQRRIQREECAC